MSVATPYSPSYCTGGRIPTALIAPVFCPRQQIFILFPPHLAAPNAQTIMNGRRSDPLAEATEVQPEQQGYQPVAREHK